MNSQSVDIPAVELMTELVELLRTHCPDLAPGPLPCDSGLTALGVTSRQSVTFLGAVDEAYGIDWDRVEETGARLATLREIGAALATRPTRI